MLYERSCSKKEAALRYKYFSFKNDIKATNFIKCIDLEVQGKGIYINVTNDIIPRHIKFVKILQDTSTPKESSCN